MSKTPGKIVERTPARQAKAGKAQSDKALENLIGVEEGEELTVRESVRGAILSSVVAELAEGDDVVMMSGRSVVSSESIVSETAASEKRGRRKAFKGKEPHPSSSKTSISEGTGVPERSCIVCRSLQQLEELLETAGLSEHNKKTALAHSETKADGSVVVDSGLVLSLVRDSCVPVKVEKEISSIHTQVTEMHSVSSQLAGSLGTIDSVSTNLQKLGGLIQQTVENSDMAADIVEVLGVGLAINSYPFPPDMRPCLNHVSYKQAAIAMRFATTEADKAKALQEYIKEANVKWVAAERAKKGTAGVAGGRVSRAAEQGAREKSRPASPKGI